jgi:hypothetical protein
MEVFKNNNILTYCSSQLNVSNPEKDQYAHSSTKKPWITKTLACAILFDLMIYEWYPNNY